jgi:hypothetical protein
LITANIVGILNFKKLKKVLKFLPVYLLLTLLVDLFSEYIDYFGENCQYVYIIFAPVEYFFISFFFYKHINNQTVKYGIIFSQISYLLICLWYFFILGFTKHYFIFNLRGFFIIVITLLYFKELYSTKEVINLKNESIFWIGIGNLFFWTGTFFTVALITPIRNIDPQMGDLLYSINPLLNIFLYSMFTKAILCNKQVYQ